jgi:transporter family-2 protein
MMTTAVWILLGLAAGAAIVLQQAANVSLRDTIGSSVWTGVVSYVGGTISMLLLAAALRAPFPAAASWGKVGAWEWTGGAFGAAYIAIAIFLVPRLGAAAFFALFVTGLMIVSVALDHFGALGFPRHAIDLPRLIGAALLVAGVVLIRR